VAKEASAEKIGRKDRQKRSAEKIGRKDRQKRSAEKIGRERLVKEAPLEKIEKKPEE
jgi:hypothetical protein